MNYRHRITLPVPSQVSSLSFTESRQFLVGSDDGSVRLYSLDTLKVLKAIRGLGSISSIAFHSQHPEAAYVWVASGRQALQFSLGTDKVISTLLDVLQVLDLGIDDDDHLGQLTINTKGTKMAFCTDSGSVGVVDLQTKEITRMKESHNNVCGSVQFVPNRPSELVSGGYDYSILHFDFMQRSTLSRDDLTMALPSSGVSLSPPFILSLSISEAGIIAAGTADGRLYIGTGGEKSLEVSSGPQRRQRKWQGLRMNDRVVADVAEGPIVALVFTESRELLTCTLLGRITQYQICGSATSGTLRLEPQWTGESKDNHKVNSIAFSERSVIIGGFRRDGTGIIEVWSTCDCN